MLNWKSRNVASVDLVVGVESPDKLRTLQFQFEEALKELGMGQSRALTQPNNLPADVGHPLWAMATQNKSFIATPDTLTLAMKFPSLPQGGIWPVVQKHVDVFDKSVSNLLGKPHVEFAGIVINTNFVYAGPEEDIHKFIAETFLKVPRNKIFSVASVSIGFQADPDWANIVYNVSGYKQFTIKVRQQEGLVAPLTVKPKASDVSEEGLQIRVDVNDRKRDVTGAAAPSQGSLSNLLPLIRRACNEGLQEISGLPHFNMGGV